MYYEILLYFIKSLDPADMVAKSATHHHRELHNRHLLHFEVVLDDVEPLLLQVAVLDAHGYR